MSGITPTHAAACTNPQPQRPQYRNSITQAAHSALLSQKDAQIADLSAQVNRLTFSHQVQALTHSNQSQQLLSQTALIMQMQQQILSRDTLIESLQHQLDQKMDIDQWKTSLNEIIALLDVLEINNITRRSRENALHQCHTLQTLNPNHNPARACDVLKLLFSRAKTLYNANKTSSDPQYREQTLAAIKDKIQSLDDRVKPIFRSTLPVHWPLGHSG